MFLGYEVLSCIAASRNSSVETGCSIYGATPGACILGENMFLSLFMKRYDILLWIIYL